MVVRFQSQASKDGKEFTLRCAEALARYGLTVIETGFRLPDCAVDIDIVAENRRGVKLLIECKGGYDTGKKKGGFKSSDNVRKALGSAYTLSRSDDYTGQPYTPLVVMTTYIMAETSVMFTWMEYTETRILADVIGDRDADRLKWWAGVDWYGVEAHIATYPTVDWVLRQNRFWGFPIIDNLHLWGAGTNGSNGSR